MSLVVAKLFGGDKPKLVVCPCMSNISLVVENDSLYMMFAKNTRKLYLLICNASIYNNSEDFVSGFQSVAAMLR